MVPLLDYCVTPPAAGLVVPEEFDPGCSSYLGCRAPSIPEGQDLSRSSSNDSSLASVVEENETETTEDYDTGMVSPLAVFQPRRWET